MVCLETDILLLSPLFLLAKNKAGKHYSDEGYLFLVWDFSDEENPKIHVRTWQPLESVSDESQIMNLNSIRY